MPARSFFGRADARMPAMKRRLLLALTLIGVLAAVPASAEVVGRFYLHLLQQQLLLHGYDPGPASGEMNGRTRWAVAIYRQDAGLPADTDLLDVLTHLRYAAPRVIAKPRAGMRHASARVAAAQFLLQKLGYLVPPIDGRLGEDTRVALAAYRRDHALAGTDIDEPLLASLTATARGQGLEVPSIIAALEAEMP
jgi:peptidoglycan hydrolase-like protein with peptidoglycan-binding domain